MLAFTIIVMARCLVLFTIILVGLTDGQGKCFNNIDTASNLMLCDCTVPTCNNESVKLVGDIFIGNGKYVQ